MRKPIRLLLVLWCAALFLASFVRAAPFDETVKAPRAASIIELPTQLRGHFDRFDSARTNARDAFIRDDAAYRKWFDLNFSLHRALDERRSLGNLSEFGFIANPDGSYTVDLQKYPQWAPLDQRLYALRAPDVIATFAARLRARGFTDSDFEAMKAYVATHDANQQLLESGKELVDSYAKRLQRGRRSGQALNLEESWAFRYQTNLVRKESERAWVIGLLDSLSNQAVRILASFFEELESTRTYIAAQEPMSVTFEKQARPLISGEYARAYEEQLSAARREANERSQKIMEIEQ